MFNHFNHLRSYVFDDEAALLMAAYPYERPTYPFPYYNEVMTGFEYVAAIGMLYEKQTDSGLLCIKNIRDRFDGRKRNPFDEIECGHHYARAMDSWAAVLAVSGFHYSAVNKSMSFTSTPGKYFWSNGYAWGTMQSEVTANGYKVTLEVLKGSVPLEQFTIDNSRKSFERGNIVGEGKSVSFEVKG